MVRAGWSIPRDAAESFPGMGAHLERYGRRLRCAEINSSFYRPPRLSTWTRWAASVPDGFRFAVKAPKAITHEAGLECSARPAALREFIEAASLLGDRLGPLLFQLPPKLAFDAAVAERFLGGLREIYAGQVAVEPRHASWFSPEVSTLLERLRIARVAADPARVPEAARPGGWSGLLYFRLPRVSTDVLLALWAEYIAALAEELEQCRAGAEVRAIFDNTASGAAIHNALELSGRLGCSLEGEG